MTELERLRKHLAIIAGIMEGDECQCMDPPQDRDGDDERGNDPDDPAAHAQYCPHYLAAYLQNLLDGKADPNPDSSKPQKGGAV